jgi:hypothetical protein
MKPAIGYIRVSTAPVFKCRTLGEYLEVLRPIERGKLVS